MPTKYFIQNKRKSLDQDFFADCMQNDQKRQCLGLLNYDRGCEWKQEESVAEINPASDMEETMEEGEVSNGCGMMQLENSSNGFSNNNNNNNNSSIVNENNNNTFHHQQLQQPTDFASCDETTFVQDPKHNEQNSDSKPKESYQIQSESSSSSTPTYYQKFNTTLGPADRFCVGGAFGYQLGLNRSYCKPSWDTIADMRTYVSDYY